MNDKLHKKKWQTFWIFFFFLVVFSCFSVLFCFVLFVLSEVEFTEAGH